MSTEQHKEPYKALTWIQSEGKERKPLSAEELSKLTVKTAVNQDAPQSNNLLNNIPISTATNYNQVIENSQWVESLSQIVLQLEEIQRRIKTGTETAGTYIKKDGSGTVVYIDTVEEKVQYLIKAIANSQKKGYKMIKDGTTRDNM